MKDVKEWIKKCEGVKLHPYTDSLGNITIGWGRNLKDNGISLDEANILFENDFDRCVHNLSQYSWFLGQPDHVKNALLNMCFNMGLPRLLGFKKMIHALINKDYTKASQEALNSTWTAQVGQRAKDVALMMRQGE